MHAANILNWIRAGLLTLPVYGVLTIWATLDPQPDPNTRLEAWSRFVTAEEYLITHLFGSTLGLILAIFGTFALGAYLATSRAGRLGLVAMVVTVFGSALNLLIGGYSTFASPEQGQMNLQGIDEYLDMPPVLAQSAFTLTFGLAILLTFVGNVLPGVAIWRSGTLPRWAGALWLASALLFYVLGAVLGMLTTGGSLLTQPLAGLLIAISGGWIAWSALRGPSARAEGGRAQPRVQ